MPARFLRINQDQKGYFVLTTDKAKKTKIKQYLTTPRNISILNNKQKKAYFARKKKARIYKRKQGRTRQPRIANLLRAVPASTATDATAELLKHTIYSANIEKLAKLNNEQQKKIAETQPTPIIKAKAETQDVLLLKAKEGEIKENITEIKENISTEEKNIKKLIDRAKLIEVQNTSLTTLQNNLNKEIAQMEIEKKKLEKELLKTKSSNHDDILKLNKDIENKTSDIEALQEQYINQEESISKLRDERIQLETDKKILASQIETMNKEKEQLQTEMNNVKMELNKNIDEKTEAVSKLTDAEQKIQEAEDEKQRKLEQERQIELEYEKKIEERKKKELDKKMDETAKKILYNSNIYKIKSLTKLKNPTEHTLYKNYYSYLQETKKIHGQSTKARDISLRYLLNNPDFVKYANENSDSTDDSIVNSFIQNLTSIRKDTEPIAESEQKQPIYTPIINEENQTQEEGFSPVGVLPLGLTTMEGREQNENTEPIQGKDEIQEEGFSPVGVLPLGLTTREGDAETIGNGRPISTCNCSMSYCNTDSPLSNFDIDDITDKLNFEQIGYVGTYSGYDDFPDTDSDIFDFNFNNKIPISFIVRTSNKDVPISHWISIIIDPFHNHEVLIYNSLAEEIPAEIMNSVSKLINELNNKYGIKYYLKIKNNLIKQQKDTTNTCGFFALAFLVDYYNGKEWKEITKFKELNEIEIKKFKKYICMV